MERQTRLGLGDDGARFCATLVPFEQLFFEAAKPTSRTPIIPKKNGQLIIKRCVEWVEAFAELFEPFFMGHFRINLTTTVVRMVTRKDIVVAVPMILPDKWK